MTNSQVNRLGDRLRKGQSLADDPEALDAYRESFIEAHQLVIRTLRDLSFEPSGRIKTAMSIVERLKRESIRLSKLQDIAGCRVVVANIKEQDRVVDRISRAFPGAKIMDRRKQPSHGYRAVHIVVGVVDSSSKYRYAPSFSNFGQLGRKHWVALWISQSNMAVVQHRFGES